MSRDILGREEVRHSNNSSSTKEHKQGKGQEWRNQLLIQKNSGCLDTGHLFGSLVSNMERPWWAVSGVLHAGKGGTDLHCPISDP